MTELPIIAVTGANGFVGGIIADSLDGTVRVHGLVRAPARAQEIAWSFDADPKEVAAALHEHGVTTIVHAAWDMTASSLPELERTCVRGSANLLSAARAAGVNRFIFVSTISAFDEARSAYGRSKLEVERMTLAAGGIVLRLGLVHGAREGGVFGGIKATVRRTPVVPLIGRGTAAQYLLHERTLGEVARRAAKGDFDGERRPILVAHPQPLPFRVLVRDIAAEEGRAVVLVPLPWRLLHAGLTAMESFGLKPGFRSDSVLSFVYQDPAPDFGPMREHNIDPIPFRTGQPGQRRLA